MNIQQIMYELDAMRKKKNSCIAVCAIVGVIFFVLMLANMISQGIKGTSDNRVGFSIAMTVVIAVPVLICMYIANDLEKKAKALYKSTLVPMVMSNRLGYVEYYSQCGFPIQSVKDAGLIADMGNSYYSEDYMRGTYAGVDYRQCDLDIKLISQKNKEYQIFKGRAFELDYMGKTVPELVICTRNYNHYPMLYNGYTVELDNVEFNNRFKVFTANSKDAFYMLTPQIMEKLLMLGARYAKFGLRFTNNRLYVAIDGLDSFELSLDKLVDYNRVMMSFESDVQTIIDLIYVINCLPKNG